MANKDEERTPDGALAGGQDLTLDDVAALLIQLEATEEAELARLIAALRRIADDEGPVGGYQQLLTKAADTLASALAPTDGGKPDVELALVEVGWLLGEAMRVRESGPDERTSAEAAEDQMAGASGSESPKPAEGSEDAPEAEVAQDGQEYRLPEDIDEELLTFFLAEAREHLDVAEASLLVLEEDPEDAEAIGTVFRAFHTIKGTAAALGLEHAPVLAHELEFLLGQVREKEIRFTRHCADLSLQAADLLRVLLDNVEKALAGETVRIPSGYGELIRRVQAVIRGEAVEDVEPAPLGVQGGEDVEPAPVETHRVEDRRPDAGRGALPREAIRQAGIVHTTPDSWARVRTDRLDRLIDMVGELVIAQSMVAQEAAELQREELDLSRNISHLGKIVRDLQDLSVSIRMVPLKNTFQRMTRLVRDLGHKTGKAVQLVTEGEDTEVDRSMVEVITDPLLHMVRNAVDHGIELPEEREAKGKPRTGTLHLAAYHAGGKVVVELRDDGRGLDRDRIMEKAIERGVVQSDQGLSDDEIYGFIFEPGFSTTKLVTDVSGRGVGMDVVRRNIEALRGSVHVSSASGAGTSFRLNLPLTLALTDGMLVRVAEERFIVPTLNIERSFRPEPHMLSTVSGRGEMVSLRGEVMPIVRLHRLFGIRGGIEDPLQALLIIVGDGRQRCAILVDELLGQQQVVLKSLGRGLGKVPGISGGTILGDGRVGLILDLGEIVTLARQDPGDVQAA